MSDIELKLGAELVKRAREGTLNGQGGVLVRKAVEQVERREAEQKLKVIAGRLPFVSRLSGDNFLRELKRLAAECRIEQWFDGEGDGI